MAIYFGKAAKKTLRPSQECPSSKGEPRGQHQEGRPICEDLISPSSCIPVNWIIIHLHSSLISTYSMTVSNKFIHSSTNSNSHTESLLLRFQTSPPSPPTPRKYLCYGGWLKFSDKSYKRENLSQRGASLTHISDQNNTLAPLPTLSRKFLVKQLPTTRSTPSRMLTIPLYHTDTSILQPPPMEAISGRQ